MTGELVYVPGGEDEFVELSRTSTGRVFRKHILSKGPLYYPGVKGGKVDIDDKFLDTIVENFNARVVSHVQAPVVDASNRHSEDPLRNIGEVIKVERDGDKLYSYIDVRDEEAANKMGKTLLGASAMLSLNWNNNKTNKRVGPALIHTAITNNAHLNDLDDFEEVLAMSSVDDSSSRAVVLSAANNQGDTIMDLDEFITKGREEFDIDIPALQRAAAESGAYAKLSAQLQETLETSGLLKLSNEGEEVETAAEDIVAAVTNIVETNVALSAKVDALAEDAARTKAEARVDALVKDGFITPAKRDSSLKLLLSNAELFEELLPEQPLVSLSSESGNEFKEESHDEIISEEIARLSAIGEAHGVVKA